MKSLVVSVNPSYFCNLRCSFCYLTRNQLSDPRKVDLDELEIKINDLSRYFKISKFDLYGGEFSTLDIEYQKELISRLKKYTHNKINLITNLTKLSNMLDDEEIHLSVSFDFSARAQHQTVFQNMSMLDRPISVLILASPKVLELDVDEMIKTLNMLKNIISVEIKPYSSNQSNSLGVNFAEFELFIKKWICSKAEKQFLFENEERIRRSINKTYRAYSDDHIYITPAGRFAVLEFDKYDREFFLELDSIQDYLHWCENEPKKLTNICKSCHYLGHCLTEHYRQVNSLEQSCNGFKYLLDWYRDEKMEN